VKGRKCVKGKGGKNIIKEKRKRWQKKYKKGTKKKVHPEA
jgi:hypothetical protein